MTYQSPISVWLNGGPYYFKSLFYILSEDHVVERVWLYFDVAAELHEAPSLKLVPFEDSFQHYLQYVGSACEILGRANPGHALTKIERHKVVTALGDPPIHSYSIYMMTVANPDDPKSERAVYIGKTNAKSHRFRQGHAAITKLHAPEFAGMTKKLYLGCVSIENDDGNIFPAEWLKEERRTSILSDVEGLLISVLQPELNEVGRNVSYDKFGFNLTVHNTAGEYLKGTSM